MDILCGVIMPFFLLFVGLIFGIKYKFFYLIHPIKTFKTILKNQKGGFKSLSLALAGTLGVGNIVGVASAISMGGYGSIFWMWISAFCAMSLKYAEVCLAMKYRKQKASGYEGGAPFYIYHGFKSKLGNSLAFVLSVIFALLCVSNSLTTGNLVQINAVSNILPVSKLLFGAIFAFLCMLVILGGKKRISAFNSVLIPLLSLSYTIVCLGIILKNASYIPNAFLLIIRDAFSNKSICGGIFGFTISSALRYGVSRGVLSNEAGCGTSPCAHASSESTSVHGQGCLGIFEVFVDTILLCTLTAFVIIISNTSLNGNSMNIVINAFSIFLGTGGKYFIGFSSILFAFATICTQFFYGSESISYFTRSKISLTIYSVLFLSVIILGAIIPMSVMWQISDFVLAIMTIINLICLIFLFKETKK
ncbi:MAG: sodium:alanine symporter family protein [Clostridia bacterium]|nr:sodium:alanine symporter family protein [Clostridia bacterium]